MVSASSVVRMRPSVVQVDLAQRFTHVCFVVLSVIEGTAEGEMAAGGEQPSATP